MSSGPFGWSLPPGCAELPGEGQEPPCAICGGDPERKPGNEGACICPECPECGEAGNPDCYRPHLVRTEEQIRQLAAMEARWAEQGAREAAMGPDPWEDAEEWERRRLRYMSEDLPGSY